MKNKRIFLLLSIFVLCLVAMSSRKIPCTGWWFDIHPKLKQECQHNILIKERRGERNVWKEDVVISSPITNSSQFRGALDSECSYPNITRNYYVKEKCKELGSPIYTYTSTVKTSLPPTPREWPPTTYITNEPAPYPEPSEEPAPIPTNGPAPYPEPSQEPAPIPTNEPAPYPEPSQEPVPNPTNEPALYPEPTTLPPYP